MVKQLVFTVCVFLFLGSWVGKQANDIDRLQWLIGIWENKTPRGSIFESWTRSNDNELSGRSYRLNGRDTILFESIRLVCGKEGLFYIPQVVNQNGGMPIQFALLSISDTKVSFENKLHDFPQLISYTKINSDSLVAEISGLKNGIQKKIAFPMKRVKE